ncbi:MAG TPA: hypothetical protein DCQ64_21105 [Candidatus Rokubacteria bacterium]|nr:hypothetical protein [Candidatus Rokubacteria bacterium]
MPRRRRWPVGLARVEYSAVRHILDAVRRAASTKLLFLPHAIRQMARPATMISAREVERAVAEGQIIEDYPEDVRGPSCLMLGSGEGRPIHVVCSPKDEYLAIITAYVPDPSQWSPDFRRRVP